MRGANPRTNGCCGRKRPPGPRSDERIAPARKRAVSARPITYPGPTVTDSRLESELKIILGLLVLLRSRREQFLKAVPDDHS